MTEKTYTYIGEEMTERVVFYDRKSRETDEKKMDFAMVEVIDSLGWRISLVRLKKDEWMKRKRRIQKLCFETIKAIP